MYDDWNEQINTVKTTYNIQTNEKSQNLSLVNDILEKGNTNRGIPPTQNCTHEI